MRSHLLNRLFAALLLGFGAYCALSVVAGPAGLIAYRELSSRREAMQANLDALGATNAALQAELEALRTDPDRTAREARDLGYLGPGETALVVQGFDGSGGKSRLEAGTVFKAEVKGPLADGLIKELSLLVAIVALVVGMTNDLLAGAPNRASGGSGGRYPFGRRKASGAGSLGGLGA